MVPSRDVPIVSHGDLGRAVRAARESRSWTQEALGAKAGVKRLTVTRLEGGAPVNSNTLFKVLAALELKLHLVPGDAPR